MGDWLSIIDRPGSSRLQVVFWIYGVVLSHAAFGLILVLYPHVSSALLAVLLFAFMVYTVWILNAVWRCADNVENPLYGQIARYLTVAWALNAALVSLFLLLAHLGADGRPVPFPF